MLYNGIKIGLLNVVLRMKALNTTFVKFGIFHNVWTTILVFFSVSRLRMMLENFGKFQIYKFGIFGEKFLYS
jgi:hypothetical protein